MILQYFLWFAVWFAVPPSHLTPKVNRISNHFNYYHPVLKPIWLHFIWHMSSIYGHKYYILCPALYPFKGSLVNSKHTNEIQTNYMKFQWQKCNRNPIYLPKPISQSNEDSKKANTIKSQSKIQVSKIKVFREINHLNYLNSTQIHPKEEKHSTSYSSNQKKERTNLNLKNLGGSIPSSILLRYESTRVILWSKIFTFSLPRQREEVLDFSRTIR